MADEKGQKARYDRMMELHALQMAQQQEQKHGVNQTEADQASLKIIENDGRKGTNAVASRILDLRSECQTELDTEAERGNFTKEHLTKKISDKFNTGVAEIIGQEIEGYENRISVAGEKALKEYKEVVPSDADRQIEYDRAKTKAADLDDGDLALYLGEMKARGFQGDRAETIRVFMEERDRRSKNQRSRVVFEDVDRQGKKDTGFTFDEALKSQGWDEGEGWWDLLHTTETGLVVRNLRALKDLYKPGSRRFPMLIKKDYDSDTEQPAIIPVQANASFLDFTRVNEVLR